MPPPLFTFPAFSPDSRGNTLESWEVAKGEGDMRSLYLCGPQEIVDDILAIAPGRCVVAAVPAESRSSYNHVLNFPNRMPAGLKDFLALSTGPLIIPCGQELFRMTALDWYKVPEDGVDPYQWSDTLIGDMIHRGKYYPAGPAQTAARTALRRVASDFVLGHPLYASSSAIVIAPGHKADGASFGERFGASVAADTGMPLLGARSTVGARLERKGGNAAPIPDGTFVFDSRLDGRVIVVDDVYRSGETIRAVARAALAAGADEVIGLTGVRTMRK